MQVYGRKALASDFDGTLYFPDLKDPFLPEDLESIRRFQAEGNLFGICTGRSRNGIRIPVQDRIRFDFYIVVSGALILDGDGKVLYQRCMSRPLIQKLCDRYRAAAEVKVQANDRLYTFAHPSENRVLIASVDEIEGDAIYGLSMEAENPETAARICAEINQYYGDAAAAFCNVENIDVVAKGCSKGAGLAFVKERLQIDEIAGIGDSYNDIPMLERADRAFTFYRSPKEVQEKAGNLVETLGEAISIFSA